MARVVRFAALTAAAFVAASFVLFAAVELRDGSESRVQVIDGIPAPERFETAIQRPDPGPAIETIREKRHSAVREGIDDVNDVLLAPFSSFTGFESVWGERFAALVLGLLLYLGGGLMLANFLPKHKSAASDWREATT